MSDHYSSRFPPEDSLRSTYQCLHLTERYKGHDRVLEVIPSLLERFPNLVYVIAGDGDDRLRLEKLAKDLGVHAAVRFTGRIDNNDLPDLYRMADVFVMPSTGEGFGIVFLEAMACGVPAVGSDSDGSIDALGEGFTADQTLRIAWRDFCRLST